MSQPPSSSTQAARTGAHSVPPSQALEHLCRCHQGWLKQVPQAKMVGWFQPGQILSTGIQVLISTTLGRQLDARNLEGLFEDEPPLPAHYLGDQAQELWFDYVSDVGDGFRPTYQLAHLLARTSVSPTSVSPTSVSPTSVSPTSVSPSSLDTTPSPLLLPRGRFLLMGGDQVYPLADRQHYRERLLTPYQLAWDQAVGERWKQGMPPRVQAEVYAIPGNHDWYDGLVSFRRLFCQDPALHQRFIGDWQAAQGRSYFVIQLPSRWWIWAVDVQLESDIDEVQLRYFKTQAEQLLPGDQVLLMTAEPEWVLGLDASPSDTRQELPTLTPESNLSLLRRFVTQRQATVRVTLAGDLHHYRRHSTTGPEETAEHLIIAGGGGAFLHPTHGTPGDSEDGELHYLSSAYQLRASFPSEQASRALTWRLWRFPFQNLGLVTLLGVYSVGICWGLPLPLEPEPMTPWTLLWEAPGRFIAGTSWLSMLLGFTPLAGLLWMQRRHAKTKRSFVLFAGLCGLLMLALPLGVHFGLTELVAAQFGIPALSAMGMGLLRLLLFLGVSGLGLGWVVAFYLGVSLNLFRENGNETFSALAGEHFKSFLRFHLTPDGTLEIFPLGVARVCTHPCEAEVQLIEPVIRVRRAKTPSTSEAAPGTAPEAGETPVSSIP